LLMATFLTAFHGAAFLISDFSLGQFRFRQNGPAMVFAPGPWSGNDSDCEAAVRARCGGQWKRSFSSKLRSVHGMWRMFFRHAPGTASNFANQVAHMKGGFIGLGHKFRNAGARWLAGLPLRISGLSTVRRPYAWGRPI